MSRLWLTAVPAYCRFPRVGVKMTTQVHCTIMFPSSDGESVQVCYKSITFDSHFVTITIFISPWRPFAHPSSLECSLQMKDESKKWQANQAGESQGGGSVTRRIQPLWYFISVYCCFDTCTCTVRNLKCVKYVYLRLFNEPCTSID